MSRIDPMADKNRFAKLLGWLAILSFALFVGALVFFLPAALRRDRSQNWPTTAGVISATGLKLQFQKPHLERWFTPVICYSYTARNLPRIGTRIDFSDSMLTLRQDAAREWLEKNYPVGKAVTVYYEPSNPDFAVLVPGAKDLIFICEWWLVMTAICGVVSLLMYRGRKTENSRTAIASVERFAQ